MSLNANWPNPPGKRCFQRGRLAFRSAPYTAAFVSTSKDQQHCTGSTSGRSVKVRRGEDSNWIPESSAVSCANPSLLARLRHGSARGEPPAPSRVDGHPPGVPHMSLVAPTLVHVHKWTRLQQKKKTASGDDDTKLFPTATEIERSRQPSRRRANSPKSVHETGKHNQRKAGARKFPFWAHLQISQCSSCRKRNTKTSKNSRKM